LKKDNQRLEEKIDNTAKSLEDKIENNNKKIDSVAKNLEDKIENTDKKIDTTAKSLENKIDATNKNLTDNFQNLGKRVDNSEFINRGIFIGLILTVLGGFAKFIGLIGNS
ncbi:MAG: coiled-coil domain-containing protein, partial [Xenococcus sp. (in: cyanobacteria)]